MISNGYIKLFVGLPFLCLIIVACGGGGGGSSNSGDAADTISSPVNTPTNQQLMNAIYHDERFPGSFYQEEDKNDGNYYIINHIKNTILPGNQNIPPYALCADDFSTAMNWSEQYNQQATVYRDLISNQDNEIYYEFTRVNYSQPSTIQLDRIFKCSAIDMHISHDDDSEQMAYFNTSSPNSNLFKKVIEYLWLISPRNNYGYSVSDTETLITESTITHSITFAHLTINGSTNQNCDLIEMETYNYSVDKTSGIVRLNKTVDSSFYSKFENNIAQTCLDP